MKKTLLTLSALITVITAGSAAANSVAINVQGRIIASPCTTVNNGKSTVDVSLGDIQATALATAGTLSPVQNFSIDFANCPPGTDEITATFTGTVSPADANSWKNAATNPAPNVSVRMFEQSKLTTPLKNNDSVTIAVTGGVASLKLAAAAYSTGLATPGDINAVIVANFTYQ